MNNEEKNIESLLKKELDTVEAPRAVFERVMQAVTNNPAHRNTEVKAPMPSPYQSISFFMKKITMIGVPVVVFVAIIGITHLQKKDDQQISPIAYDIPSLTPEEERTVLAQGSVGAIADTFTQDGINDAQLADAESEDVALVGEEFDAFINIESSYENTF
jgi:hypothetical protein